MPRRRQLQSVEPIAGEVEASCGHRVDARKLVYVHLVRPDSEEPGGRRDPVPEVRGGPPRVAGQGLTPAALAFVRDHVAWADCEDQGVELGVNRAHLAHAWAEAMRRARLRRWPTMRDAVALARVVAPERNARGAFAVGPRGMRERHIITGQTLCIGPRFVPGEMRRLFSRTFLLDPDEFYRRFQHIHPFVDGNGRTGVLLHNWLCGSLASPASPPWFWGPPDGDPTRRPGA